MTRSIKFLIFFIFTLTILFPGSLAYAQDDVPDLPVYIVQAGDTLNEIALRFNVSVDDLIAVNNITNPNFLQANAQLVIPGIEGVRGILTYRPVQLGQTPKAISRSSGLTLSSLYKLNKVTSPSEFFLGSNIIITEPDPNQLDETKNKILNKPLLLETAIVNKTSTWEISKENYLTYSWQYLPDDLYYLKSFEGSPSSGENEIRFSGLPLTQGKTSVIKIDSDQTPQATIGDQKINFVSLDGYQTAIFGIHAMQDPGLYPFHLQYTSSDGINHTIDQLILIQLGFYPKDPPLYVSEETLDENLNKSEDALIFEITAPVTSNKYWDGTFRYPVDDPVCIRSWFGNRRSYNDQPYNRFHAGVDFGVCANLNIYAPAPGVVVYTGPLDVRGNVTIIDHGLGVYSGFWHQAAIQVEVGQEVNTGDLIGTIGSTGRSTGPHLHWEMIVNGVQVDPLDWLDNEYP